MPQNRLHQIVSEPLAQRVFGILLGNEALNIDASYKGSTKPRFPARLATVLFLVAVLVNVLIAIRVTNGVQADGPFFIGIAHRLAAGKGFVNSFYGRDLPTMTRAPLWPAILAISIRLFPNASDAHLLRDTAVVVNILNSMLLFALTWFLSRSGRVSIVAGLGYTLYPSALAMAADGYCEIPFVFFAILGTLLIILGGAWSYWGALSLGLSVVTRSNFVLLPCLVALTAVVLFGVKRVPLRFIVLAIIFWIPAFLWTVRNYTVSGEFPVLSTQEGETLYGANNLYVATDLGQWGYWVFPDEIPGEPIKKSLAVTMTESQINHYYHQKGIAFLKANWFALPRLELGKLIRGFAPIPWVPSWGSYFAFFCRGVLYLVAILSLRFFRKLNPNFQVMLAAAFLSVLMTTVIYYGCARFSFCFEVFLIPLAIIGLFCRAQEIAGGFENDAPTLVDA